MKRDSKPVNDVNEFIEEYAQSNHILDQLAQHTFEAELTLPQKLERLELELIRAALCNNNISQAAAELGISRELLHYKIKKYQKKL